MDNFRDSYFQVDWDLTSKRLRGTYWGKQYDTGRGFSVTVINGGQVVAPTTEVLRLKWEKPDNTTGYVNATIVNGKFVIENIDQMFTVHGNVRADFELSVGGEFVASITFYVNVEKAVAVDAVASSSQFTALQDAVGSVDSLQQQFDNVVANVTVDSEVIAARGTEATLGARLDSTEQDYIQHKLDYEKLWQVGKNLFNNIDIVKNSYVEESTGLVKVHTIMDSTNFIEITSSKDYCLNPTTDVRLAFYDTNKVYISGMRPVVNPIKTPVNAKYIRFSTTVRMLQTIQLEEGTTPTVYEPYRKQIRKDLIRDYDSIFIEENAAWEVI